MVCLRFVTLQKATDKTFKHLTHAQRPHTQSDFASDPSQRFATLRVTRDAQHPGRLRHPQSRGSRPSARESKSAAVDTMSLPTP